jgi:hypothetical protein
MQKHNLAKYLLMRQRLPEMINDNFVSINLCEYTEILLICCRYEKLARFSDFTFA